MASLWRHPKSQYFTACFRDQNGRLLKISTKETNRKSAQKIADEYEKAARTKRTLKQVQATLDRFHEELSGEKIVRATLRKDVEEWTAEKKPTTASSTLAFYKSSLGKFTTFLDARADEPITGITKADIVAFRNKLASQVSAKTANHDLKAVKMLFKSAKRDGKIAEDPTEFVESVRQKQATTAKRAFALGELKSIIAAADDEWKSMIYCGLYTGQRLADVAALRWSAVDLGKGEIRLVTRKTNRSMVIPIAAPLKKFLGKTPETARKSGAPIHPKAFAIVERERKSGSLSNQFTAILATAGLRKKVDHKKHKEGRDTQRAGHELSFHSLRRTATTFLHEAKIPGTVAQALIGHDSEAIHQLYVSVGDEALQRAAASLPDIG
jgi:integrase